MFKPVIFTQPSGFTLPKLESTALTVTTYSLGFLSFLVFLYASFRGGRHPKKKGRPYRRASHTTTTKDRTENYISPWEILGVPYGATESEIKKRYHQLARTYHPDKNVNGSEWATDQMMRINAAYEVLKPKPVMKPRFDDNARTQMPYSGWQDCAADTMARAGAQTQGLIDGFLQFKFSASEPMDIAAHAAVLSVAFFLSLLALWYQLRLVRMLVRKVRVFMRTEGDISKGFLRRERKKARKVAVGPGTWR